MVTAYFLDSSALLKRYVPEIGTQAIQSLTLQSSQNLLIVARITSVEVQSASVHINNVQLMVISPHQLET